jgi:hypothetical protein
MAIMAIILRSLTAYNATLYYYLKNTHHSSRRDCLVTLVFLKSCSVFETKLGECFSLQGGVTMWLKASNSHQHMERTPRAIASVGGSD